MFGSVKLNTDGPLTYSCNTYPITWL
uniref:Uncharacterized protein n=1 Tax=Anguilla anguilla TaxID=7936 RepID=A0A0E9W5P2_ANGAN